MSDDAVNTSSSEPIEDSTGAVVEMRTATPTWLKWYLALTTIIVLMLAGNVSTLDQRLQAHTAPTEVAEQSLYEQPQHLGQLIDRVKSSVVIVNCGDWSGTGWAIDLEAPAETESLALYEEFPYSVITNEHVIADCESAPESVSIVVDGVESNAYLESFDSTRDLALLMVTPELPGLEVGSRPMPGAWVMTVGNPLELTQAVSIGNVMNIDGIDLVNSAPINHGNSGGPLVNSRGRVVGVTTWVRIATADDPTDTPQDWNVATTIPALCKEIIDCDNDPQWTWK